MNDLNFQDYRQEFEKEFSIPPDIKWNSVFYSSSKSINGMLMNFGLEVWVVARNQWNETEIVLPEEGVPVIGFNEKWIDIDFNPDGIRECFRYGDGDDWKSIWWDDNQDCYETQSGRTGDDAPTHWRNRPSSKHLIKDNW